MAQENSDWFDDYAEGADDIQIGEYDITATPNDFNVMTLNSFVESGAVRIPGFQRNFVWDIGRSSKLIESLLLGLPVPQLFLYEQDRNRFLVIDGQQRLMSIYYFIKKRFPRKEKRTELRIIFDEKGGIPDEILHDDSYFQTFNLKLPGQLPNHENKFKGLNYSTLGEYKTQLDLRPIRNIVVRQNSPTDDDSSMYEVFNRLNTGGVNLKPQEIRTSMYHSKFYEMLYHVNMNSTWRLLINSPEPDLHMKDIEILLRAFAMLIDGDNYKPSMVKFLNQFSKKCESNTKDQNKYLCDLFTSFISSCEKLPSDIFLNRSNRRFNIAVFEAVFNAASKPVFDERNTIKGNIKQESIRDLAVDPKFIQAAQEATTRASNVEMRLNRAHEIIEFE
jgi:uncharacterized protein with ParB-like and HNH nuclease domain